MVKAQQKTEKTATITINTTVTPAQYAAICEEFGITDEPGSPSMASALRAMIYEFFEYRPSIDFPHDDNSHGGAGRRQRRR